MGIQVKWDATLDGIEIAFDVDGETHRSGLSWANIEDMRYEMARDLQARIPKNADGFEAGREHQRRVDGRLHNQPGLYTKLADEMRAEREAADEADRAHWLEGLGT